MQLWDEIRGLAVLGVLAFHTVAILYSSHRRLPFYLWPFAAGKLGVDVFFVLSGFVIARSWGRVSDDARTTAQFLSRRVHRLFPVYWASLTVFVALKTPELLSSMHGMGVIALHAIGQQFMTHTGAWQINSPYWTLTPTIHFYLLFPLMMFAIRRTKVQYVLGALVAVSVGFRLFVHTVDQWPPDTIVGRIDQFAVGVAVALASSHSGAIASWLRRRRVQLGAAILGAALILVYGSAWIGVPHQKVWTETLVHPAFALALGVGFLGLRGGGGRSLARRGLAGLGRISYSLYLWHLPIFDGLGHRFGALGVVAAFALSTVVAIASYEVFERRSVRLGDLIAFGERHIPRMRRAATYAWADSGAIRTAAPVRGDSTMEGMPSRTP